MSTVWTPLKQPPHPTEVYDLSSDARRVLEALRTAYQRKCHEQKDRLLQRSVSQQSQHYYRNLNTQTSQHVNVTQRQQHVKQELSIPPPAPPPLSPPLCVDDTSGTQHDNTAVGTSFLRQSSHQALEHGVNDSTDVSVSSQRQITHHVVTSAEHVLRDDDNEISFKRLSSHQSIAGTEKGTNNDVLMVDNEISFKRLSSHEAGTENLHKDLLIGDIADSGPSFNRNQTCEDASAERATSVKSSSSASVTSRPSLLTGEDDCGQQLQCMVQKNSVEDKITVPSTQQQEVSGELCKTSHLSSMFAAKLYQFKHQLNKGQNRCTDIEKADQKNINSLTTPIKEKKTKEGGSMSHSTEPKRKRRCSLSVGQGGTSSLRKVQSSFQTPFKDVGHASRVETSQQNSGRQMLEQKKTVSTTSVKDSFMNLAKLTTEKDKTLFENKLKNATEIVMTLLYKDKSSQLRETNQNKNSKLDDAPESIAACMYYHELASESTETGNMSSVGSGEDLQQCFVLFPLDGGDSKKWTSDILLSVMRSEVRKICFDAQELMHAIITQYQLPPFEVCCKWQLLDPKTAAWLKDPDNPPITFSDVLQMCRDIDKQALKSLNSESTSNPTCKDLIYLSWCMQVLYKQLKKKQLWDLFLSVETKLTPILAAMEVQGFGVDVKVLKTYGSKLRARIDDLEDQAHKAAGCSFQVSSHVQLRQILFDQLKLDQKLQGQKLARTNVQNLKSTSEAVLSKLQDLHPLPKIVLEYRQLMKLNSTYVDGLLEFVNNGCLHTSWEQTSASTGRVQSASPNIQNIPKQPIIIETEAKKGSKDLEAMEEEAFTIFAREPFVSQQGWTLIAADFQSIELRLLAHMSGDRVLLKVFNNKDCLDVFVELASEWLGMKPNEVTTADREKTKRIVYSVIYGVGPERLAETLTVTKDEAKAFMKSFLNKFKGVSSFSHCCISSCQRHNGEVRTIFNRLRLVPNINSSNFHARSYAERQAVNFVVQGSAADICKIAMIQVMHTLSTKPDLHARLLVQIHDELLLEVPDEHVQEVKDILKSVMEATDTLCGQKVSLKVPLPVSVSQGKNWGHLVAS